MNALVLLAAAPLAFGAIGDVPQGGSPVARASSPDGASASGQVPPAAPPPGALPALRARRSLPVVFRFLRRKPLVPPHDEALRYDVSYGLLGSIGSVRIDAGAATGRPGAPSVVRLQGEGAGSILGFGAMQNDIESEFDAALLGSRRWRSVRGEPRPGVAGARTLSAPIVDDGSWVPAGRARLLRRKPGRPDESYSFEAALQTSDPLGLVWRLRTLPPALGASDTLQVVDGLALWRVRATTTALADPVPGAAPGVRALRVEGVFTPVHYDGGPDPSRGARHFTMWLDRAPGHVPLRITVPLGPGELVIRLVEARPRAGRASSAQPGVPAPGARSL